MTPSIFLDTNVFLDAYLNRRPSVEHCFSIFLLAENNEIEAYTTSSCLLQVIYFLQKDKMPVGDVIALIKHNLKFCKIICTNASHFVDSFLLDFDDLEDAIQYQTALNTPSIGYFVTSNTKDFIKADSSIKVVTPKQFLQNHSIQ